MNLISKEFNKYKIQQLTKKLAIKYSAQLASLANLIPQVAYTEKEILAETKDERIFYGKWDHSLILFDNKKPIAIAIAYERESEKNDQYPQNTIYLSELAVDKQYQGKGIAKNFLKSFFSYNNKVKLKYLKGDLNYTIQTNSANWNKHVQDLYKSFGFFQRATKNYENRVDLILGLNYPEFPDSCRF